MKALSYLSLSLVLMLSACASQPKLERVDASKEIELTDKWNARDSREVAEAMMDDMLSFPWYLDFRMSRDDAMPRVIVQTIRNKSHEHIPVDTFINDIKRSLLRSGKIDFVAGGAERDDIRDEKLDQELNSSADTLKALGQEYGADYALTGEINSYVDSLNSKRVTYYQVDLKLIDILTNREVWIGQKKIQKLMTR
ncbi:penicillin-binding protein activator LpoB [Gynuella sunshinyii]|uniref:Collagen-binding surface adhesin SpaP (Antigen I/II family) n=1 Tax=Gynuella sunshinyii YC6258 TaxID=1445510 RepID=A0A0C5VKF1_9GAMM|nr:penicillin-binding protein activator LpoB [Gynuella sunshinyii]AJQ93873.1 collagen-binding surface adhesin SpaP (antigen I/II family) [Gynuella sunshinyii YC6258]